MRKMCDVDQDGGRRREVIGRCSKRVRCLDMDTRPAPDSDRDSPVTSRGDGDPMLDEVNPQMVDGAMRKSTEFAKERTRGRRRSVKVDKYAVRT